MRSTDKNESNLSTIVRCGNRVRLAGVVYGRDTYHMSILKPQHRSDISQKFVTHRSAVQKPIVGVLLQFARWPIYNDTDMRMLLDTSGMQEITHLH